MHRNQGSKMKKNVVLNELDTIWPAVVQVRTRLLSGTFNKLSFLRRRASESSTSLLSSSLNNTNSTMQNCWSSCQPDISIETSSSNLKGLPPCEFCFEPENQVIMTDIFNINRDRQCSEPVSVPDSLTTKLINSQQQGEQAHSSDYGSTCGNELSPTTNYWIAGVNDLSSDPSITSDEQDRSVFDDNSTTGVPEEDQTNLDNDDDDDNDDDSFEVLSFEAPPESTIYIKEFQYTTADSQNNVCACCNVSFTSISNIAPRRCYYYGKLYCSRCHIMDLAHIPAKIIKSFDMHLYPVCRRAKTILQSNLFQPIFDIQHDNANLYTLIPLLSEIKILRAQIQHFYAYLSTCTRIGDDLHDKFFNDFFARDYLYQSVHLYSLNDLLSLKKILHILTQTSIKSKQHVHQCMICKEKGFFCEICKNRQDILYPFDDSKTIGQCNQCSNIYHRQCWNNIDRDCPKCYRIIQRRQQQQKNHI